MVYFISLVSCTGQFNKYNRGFKSLVSSVQPSVAVRSAPSHTAVLKAGQVRFVIPNVKIIRR
jgi:hypothetical protein